MNDLELQIKELRSQLEELRKQQQQMNQKLVLAENHLKTLIAIIQQDQPSFKLQDEIDTAFSSAKPVSNSKTASENFNQTKTIKPVKKRFQVNRETEDFIGTNVISKIGILVTIVGVFIGAKYAIDNELISPTMRIITGYASAAVLVFIAFRMKKKYEYFSSVLLAGGLAVTYFITYIAFSFYALFPIWMAFVLMLLTTTASVGFSLWYNQKVIALIGQVAAYAIPFLLGNKNGNVFGLFAYMSLINVGLLILSFKKDWKLLYHIAFFLTWIFYISWLATASQIATHFSSAIIFLSVNFFTFYVTFLSYKIIRKELYQISEMSILLLNALFFFFTGLYLINQSFDNNHFLTWFSVLNAGIHLITGFIIYRFGIADKTVFQFVLALGLLFITIAIPIEFNSGWVTLLWTIEATALFYIAYANKRSFYLTIARPLVVVATLSLLQDWSYAYPFFHGGVLTNFTSQPFLNGVFWLSLFVCGCLGYISYAAQKIAFADANFSNLYFFKIVIPVVFLFALYFTFYNEIHLSLDKIIDVKQPVSIIENLQYFQSLLLITYSCVYVASWLTINKNSTKIQKLDILLFAGGIIINFIFLTRGLYLIGALRENYLAGTGQLLWLVSVRYAVFFCLALLWISAWKSFKNDRKHNPFIVIFSVLFNIVLLSVISNEFIHWMDIAGYQNQYKLGLSLIGGGYALALIFAGIIKNKKHLRILAMILFSVTLIKLFFYDLSYLSTISKTIVLVLLGILLLFASFLYNKYKEVLSGKEEPEV